MMLLNGDCLQELKKLEPNSIDSIVTDPPYGLSKEPDIYEVLSKWMLKKKYEHKSAGFMGKNWDSFVPGPEYWKECFRVLKPGGYLACFSGARTVDLMGISLRMAGFEMHPMLGWLYASGFPKATNLSKMFDKEAGAEREVIGTIKKTPSASSENMNDGWKRPWAENHPKTMDITAPTTDLAKKWDGWFYGKQSLKPAIEPILLVQKPIEGKMLDNIRKWGTGAINIDGCRVGTESTRRPTGNHQMGKDSGWNEHNLKNIMGGSDSGRFPANLLIDEYAAKLLDEQSGILKTGGQLYSNNGSSIFGLTKKPSKSNHIGSSGGGSRFFNNFSYHEEDFVPFKYCAKVSAKERNLGCDDMPDKDGGFLEGNTDLKNARKIGARPDIPPSKVKNNHPTVKPTTLIHWLVTLLTPHGGTVLDPFMGSGTCGIAAKLCGVDFVGVEMNKDYFKIAEARIASWEKYKVFIKEKAKKKQEKK